MPVGEYKAGKLGSLCQHEMCLSLVTISWLWLDEWEELLCGSLTGQSSVQAFLWVIQCCHS